MAGAVTPRVQRRRFRMDLMPNPTPDRTTLRPWSIRIPGIVGRRELHRVRHPPESRNHMAACRPRDFTGTDVTFVPVFPPHSATEQAYPIPGTTMRPRPTQSPDRDARSVGAPDHGRSNSSNSEGVSARNSNRPWSPSIAAASPSRSHVPARSTIPETTCSHWPRFGPGTGTSIVWP